MNDSDKLRTDSLVHHARPLDLQATDTVRLDKYLIGNRLGAHDPPRRPVIFQLLLEQLPAQGDHLLELFLCIWHTILDYTREYRKKDVDVLENSRQQKLIR